MLNTESSAVTAPTFHGFIDSTYDALVLFEACQRGICPKVTRRLQEKERHLITSGSIFVFDEKESGIKRWTDGLLWSPSRILGNFLIYRELDSREPSGKGTGLSAQDVSPRTGSQRDRCLTSSTYRFKNNGLVKKTISLADMHIICYYRVNDVVDGRLRHPSSVPELLSLDISASLLMNQNFRVPVKVEIGADGHPRFAGESDDATMTGPAPAQHLQQPLPSDATAASFAARKRSPAGHPLSIDTSSLPDFNDPTSFASTGPTRGKAGSGAPSGLPSPPGVPRPPNMRAFSSGSSSAASGTQMSLPGKQRYEPYPVRPSAHYTAPVSPATSVQPLPHSGFVDPWSSFAHQRVQWAPSYHGYNNPQTMMDASRDGQSPAAQVNPSHIMAKRPSHSRQAQEWANVDYRYGMPMPITSASDRYSSAPSSTSSNSVDLPSSSDGVGLGLKPGPAAAGVATLPPRSNSLGGQPSGLDHPASGASDPATSAAAFPETQYPLGYAMEDHHELFGAQPLPPRSMSRDLSGHFQRLDTGAHSDGSSSSSAFDPSRRNSVASTYSPASSGLYLASDSTANHSGLGVSLQTSPASATFGGPQPFQPAPHAPPRRGSTLSMSQQFMPEPPSSSAVDHSNGMHPPAAVEPSQLLRASSSAGLAHSQKDMVVTSSQVSPRLYTSSSMPQMSNLEHAPSSQHLYDPSWSFMAARPSTSSHPSPALSQMPPEVTSAWSSVPQ